MGHAEYLRMEERRLAQEQELADDGQAQEARAPSTAQAPWGTGAPWAVDGSAAGTQDILWGLDQDVSHLSPDASDLPHGHAPGSAHRSGPAAAEGDHHGRGAWTAWDIAQEELDEYEAEAAAAHTREAEFEAAAAEEAKRWEPEHFGQACLPDNEWDSEALGPQEGCWKREEVYAELDPWRLRSEYYNPDRRDPYMRAQSMHERWQGGSFAETIAPWAVRPGRQLLQRVPVYTQPTYTDNGTIISPRVNFTMEVYLEYEFDSDTRAGLASQSFLEQLLNVGGFPVYGLRLVATQVNTLVIYAGRINYTDTTPPVITRVGDANVRVPLYGTYEDLGATARDDLDTDIPRWKIITRGLPINTSVLTPAGQPNIITYDVFDFFGLPAQTVS